jgi:hypothetical protein
MHDERHDPAEDPENPDDHQSEHDPAGDPENPDDQPELEKARYENLELQLKIIGAGLAVLLTLVEQYSAISNIGY